MKFKLVPGAQADLEAIFAAYEEKGAGLGAKFAREAFHTIDVVVENPLAWQRIYKQTRRSLLRRFPYMVVYEMEPDLIVIVAIIHQRRRPGAWRNRLNRNA